MADFDFVAEFLFQGATDFCHDAEAGNAGGFVDQNNCVLGIWEIASVKSIFWVRNEFLFHLLIISYICDIMGSL